MRLKVIIDEHVIYLVILKNPQIPARKDILLIQASMETDGIRLWRVKNHTELVLRVSEVMDKDVVLYLVTRGSNGHRQFNLIIAHHCMEHERICEGSYTGLHSGGAEYDLVRSDLGWREIEIVKISRLGTRLRKQKPC